MSSYTRLIGATLAALILCAGQSDSESPKIVQPGAPGQPGRIVTAAEASMPRKAPARADIEFMQGMIIHHSQAVDMVTLLRARGSGKALQTLGNRMTISQTDEIEFMKQWLRERRQPIGARMTHNAGGLMPGMLSLNQMKALALARGAAFDQLFLTGMIQHHTGALDMVEDLLATPGAGQDNILFDFATDIDNTQRAEIEIMKRMLAKVAVPATKGKK